MVCGVCDEYGYVGKSQFMNETNIVSTYAAARIRRTVPAGASVVPGSTPVVAFGNVGTAWVATLGLNPSKIEFLDAAGKLLEGEDQRLETLKSLGVTDLSSAPDAAVNQVLAGCNAYFAHRPYSWFDKLERVLGHVGASYHDGSACHLDLVQWATDPVWRNLNHEIRDALLDADIPFLQQQLSHECIQVLLLNGMGIVRACRKRLQIDLDECQRSGTRPVKIIKGRTDRGLLCVGWNVNLQSSFGVSSEEIEDVGNAVAAIVKRDIRTK